jgi:hypothetical protein
VSSLAALESWSPCAGESLADLKLKFSTAFHFAAALIHRRLILLLFFGAANALLYACLLPLWEGFDEPFHYAYVTSLSADHQIPALGRTAVSREIEQSLFLTPLPYVMSHPFVGTSSFDDWGALSVTERLARRNALEALPRPLRREPSELPNHEAQQAPLAYILLAPLDWLLSDKPLTSRILTMRLAISLVSTLLLAGASIALFRALGLERRFQDTALFCLFATPMTWAAIAHIGNDWLAIPVATAFLAALVVFSKERGKCSVIWLSIFLSAGLLTKAYFLAFIPIFVAILFSQVIRRNLTRVALLQAMLIPLVVAGPWYMRNLLLYGTVSGTQESVAGIGIVRTLGALPHINWIVSFVRLARSSIWTGNWSYISFPRAPLHVELIMVGLAFALLFAGRRKLASAERWLLATCAVFLLAVAYAQAAMWAFNAGPGTWYLPAIAPGVLCLAALGLQRGAWFGRILAILLAVTAAGISAYSYLGVLFPWYGGFRGSGVGQILGWWLNGNPSLLSTVALVSSPWLFWLLSIFWGLLIVATVTVIRGSVERPVN